MEGDQEVHEGLGRWLGLGLFALVVVVGWLLLTPATASALVCEPYVCTSSDTAYWDLINANYPGSGAPSAASAAESTASADVIAGGGTAAQAGEAVGGITDVAVGAGTIADAFPPIAVGVTGLAIGWYMGSVVDRWLGITGDSAGSTTRANFSTADWIYYPAGTDLSSAAGYGGYSSDVIASAGTEILSLGSGALTINMGRPGTASDEAQATDVAGAWVNIAPADYVTWYNGMFPGTPITGVEVKTTSRGGALQGLSSTGLQTFGSQSVTHSTSGVPTPLSEAAALAAARAYVASLPALNGYRLWLDNYLSPGYDPGYTTMITVPTPASGELCTGFLADLTSAGFTGSRTCAVGGAPDYTLPPLAALSATPAFGSSVAATAGIAVLENPATVDVPTPSPLRELGAAYLAQLHTVGLAGSSHTNATDDPRFGASEVTGTDPAPGTSLATGSSVNYQVNSATAPDPVAAVPGTPPGGCTPWVSPALDLSPLNVNVGNLFPFGVFGWVYAALTSWSTAGVAPSWTFNFGTPFGYDWPMTMSLASAQPAVDIIRPVLLIASTLLLVWWLATAFLSLNDSGEDK